MFPSTVYDLDADANNCKYTVSLAISPTTAEIVENQGTFEVAPDWRKVNIVQELTHATMTIQKTIAVGTYQVTITFTDSANPPDSIVKNLVVIATDECLTNGLTVPYNTGDLDTTYIVEDPLVTLNIDGITNGECVFTLEVQPEMQGQTLSDLGLSLIHI